jgi:hypothetical protein
MSANQTISRAYSSDLAGTPNEALDAKETVAARQRSDPVGEGAHRIRHDIRQAPDQQPRIGDAHQVQRRLVDGDDPHRTVQRSEQRRLGCEAHHWILSGGAQRGKRSAHLRPVLLPDGHAGAVQCIGQDLPPARRIVGLSGLDASEVDEVVRAAYGDPKDERRDDAA